VGNQKGRSPFRSVGAITALVAASLLVASCGVTNPTDPSASQAQPHTKLLSGSPSIAAVAVVGASGVAIAENFPRTPPQALHPAKLSCSSSPGTFDGTVNNAYWSYPADVFGFNTDCGLIFLYDRQSRQTRTIQCPETDSCTLLGFAGTTALIDDSGGTAAKGTLIEETASGRETERPLPPYPGQPSAGTYSSSETTVGETVGGTVLNINNGRGNGLYILRVDGRYHLLRFFGNTPFYAVTSLPSGDTMVVTNPSKPQFELLSPGGTVLHRSSWPAAGAGLAWEPVIVGYIDGFGLAAREVSTSCGAGSSGNTGSTGATGNGCSSSGAFQYYLWNGSRWVARRSLDVADECGPRFANRGGATYWNGALLATAADQVYCAPPG